MKFKESFQRLLHFKMISEQEFEEINEKIHYNDERNINLNILLRI